MYNIYIYIYIIYYIYIYILYYIYIYYILYLLYIYIYIYIYIYYTGFPKCGQLVGGQFGQNDQKLHENYKIGIWLV